MPSRETGTRASRQNRRGTTTRTAGRKTTRKTTRKAAPPAFELSLRPEHRRELFALALLTIASLTLIFFFTGKTGGVGRVYVLGVLQAFGDGALAVPLALGALGVAILIQERLHGSDLTGANVLGTLMVLSTLLAMFELPLHHIHLEERVGKGGGLIGYWLVYLFDAAIGRPATLVLLLMLMLVGILLTFNITLRELISDMAGALYSLRRSVWSEASLAPPRQQHAAPARLPDSPTLAFEAPPQTGSDNDIVPTPIAARLTRASLFRRAQDELATGSAAARAAQDKSAQPPTPAAAPAQLPAAPSRTGKEQPPPTQKAAADPATAQKQPAGEKHVQEVLEGFDAPAIYRAWSLPMLEFLDAAVEGSISDDEIREKSWIIEETLKSFKVEAQVVGVNRGPAVTQFELQPAVGVKISKITSLEKDLALALAASSIRIEAPIPGKSVVGIEIPNSAISVVSLREVMDSEEFEASKGKLKLPLGKDVSGNPVIADMTRMPHLLVAGSTGSGKSVAINAFLCGLLLKHTPEELKLILVDPKMVELIVYNRIPHLLSPVVTELERVVPTLKWATREMERRYKVFARHGCRNLESYKQLAQRRAELEPMPYILIVIDELADLMMMAPDEIETYICRLAQMARATGIHLIIATQRPSVDVITGLIKANFPSRIAFAVTSQIDSRVILDTPGADQLLGRGDMLYMAADSAKLVRIQGTYVADREVERLVSFWRSARPPEQQEDGQPQPQPQKDTASHETTTTNGDPEPTSTHENNGDPEALSYNAPAGFLSTDEQEELMPQALALVRQHKRASASLLQRRLRIGYSKAAQLIDLLEQQGVVGPAEGGRSREVIQDNE